MKTLVLLLAVTLAGIAQQQQQPAQDFSALVGKQVIAQRMPLCEPGTFTVVLSYAGKTAKVMSIKSSNLARLSEEYMDKLSPQARAMMEDQQKAATILVQFGDGKQLDTCAPVAPSRISDYFEIAGDAASAPSAQEVPTTPPGNASVAVEAGPPPAIQSADMLSTEEVRMAIGGSGRNHFVWIMDAGLMAAQGNQVPSITLYMPEAVLAIQAESARKQFIQFQPSDEEKRRSLMIVAEGYAGKTIAEGCTSVTRIVLLSDRSGTVVKEAYLSEPLTETWRNNLGATDQCQALRAKFSLEDVHKVREAAPSGEFLVAVFAGAVNTKMYKVKKKHQSKLGLD